MLAHHCFAGRSPLMAEAQNGTACAVLPLVQEQDHLVSLANYYSFSYAPIFEQAEDTATRLTLMTRIAADLRAKHGCISLYPLIDDDDGMPGLLRRAFARAGWIAILTPEGSNHIVDLEGRSFAAYWKSRPGALRSSVQRKGKSARFTHEIHHNLSDALWSEYTGIYAASWKEAEAYPAMIRAIAEEATSRGALRLAITRDESRAVAVQLWTIEGETACIHKIAHDSAEDARSPGTLLSHHMFAHMIDVEKVARIDYGTGDNAYKRDWMERARPMLRLDCFDPWRARFWLPALRTRISNLVGRRG